VKVRKAWRRVQRAYCV